VSLNTSAFEKSGVGVISISGQERNSFGIISYYMLSISILYCSLFSTGVIPWRDFHELKLLNAILSSNIQIIEVSRS
jgi:hypothetical protein